MPFARKRRARVLAMGLWLGLMVGPAPAPRAEGAPVPPTGAHRLIRIGPQALISEDETGKVSMVDEPEPQATFSPVGFVFAALTGGLGGVMFTNEPRNVGIGAAYGGGNAANQGAEIGE